jgi:hypothetical protein
MKKDKKASFTFVKLDMLIPPNVCRFPHSRKTTNHSANNIFAQKQRKTPKKDW